MLWQSTGTLLVQGCYRMLSFSLSCGLRHFSLSPPIYSWWTCRFVSQPTSHVGITACLRVSRVVELEARRLLGRRYLERLYARPHRLHKSCSTRTRGPHSRISLVIVIARIHFCREQTQSKGSGQKKSEAKNLSGLYDGRSTSFRYRACALLCLGLHAFLRLDRLLALDDRERGQNLADVTPPALAVGSIPIHRRLETLFEAGLLSPAESLELGRIHGVPAVVERSISRVLDSAVHFLLRRVGQVEESEQADAEGHVCDLVRRTDVIDLADRSAVQNGIKGIGGVTGVEVPPRMLPITVQEQLLVAVQQASELGDDLCQVRQG